MSGFKKFIYSWLERFVKKSFPLWQRFGYHLTPYHYYQPIPDIRDLEEDLWSKQSDLVGIDLNERKQLELLSLFVSRYKDEYASFPRYKTSVSHEYFINNYFFESVDGEILYCMVRYFKPKRIIEIGAGFSTYLSAQAILYNKKEDDSYECELRAIEPYPNDILKAGFPGLTKLISTRVQDIPFSMFTKLQENDILFIDSSHVLKIGSDVKYEYLEILPRLNKGVIVHTHDIFLPAEYPRDWVIKEHRFWTEQYLLQAFLTFNESFEVIWAANYIHLEHPSKLGAAFSSYMREDTLPASFWIRKTK